MDGGNGPTVGGESSMDWIWTRLDYCRITLNYWPLFCPYRNLNPPAWWLLICTVQQRSQTWVSVSAVVLSVRRVLIQTSTIWQYHAKEYVDVLFDSCPPLNEWHRQVFDQYNFPCSSMHFAGWTRIFNKHITGVCKELDIVKRAWNKGEARGYECEEFAFTDNGHPSQNHVSSTSHVIVKEWVLRV